MLHAYKPVLLTQHDRSYFERSPHVSLKPYIDCYWMSQTQEANASSKIIPDFCADLLLHFDKEGRLKRIQFCGPQSTFFYHAADANEQTIGVRLFTWALTLFSEASLAGTANLICSAEAGFQHFYQTFAVYLDTAHSFEFWVTQLDLFFLQQLHFVSNKKLNPAVLNVIHHFMHTPQLSFDEVLKKEVLSNRQLQRLFRENVGLSLKETHNIIRLQHILTDFQQQKWSDMQDLIYHYGFYDQSHFYKFMKKTTNENPLQLLKKMS